jgi:hypothetical protein
MEIPHLFRNWIDKTLFDTVRNRLHFKTLNQNNLIDLQFLQGYSLKTE